MIFWVFTLYKHGFMDFYKEKNLLGIFPCENHDLGVILTDFIMKTRKKWIFFMIFWVFTLYKYGFWIFIRKRTYLGVFPCENRVADVILTDFVMKARKKRFFAFLFLFFWFSLYINMGSWIFIRERTYLGDFPCENLDFDVILTDFITKTCKKESWFWKIIRKNI
jgi:hypothetical protein